MTSFIPMFCLIMAGDPSPTVRKVAGNLSKMVWNLPSGSVRDAIQVALVDREARPDFKELLKQLREAEEEIKRMKKEMVQIDRRLKNSERNHRNPDFPNYEDYGPKLKKRVDG